MNPIISTLLTSNEPSVSYQTRVYLLDENPDSPALRQLQAEIKTSGRVQCLLSERNESGKLPYHPYSRKWYGAHWILLMLAELDYPPGDADLLPLRDQIYEFLFSKAHIASIEPKTIAGRVRMCASVDANPIYFLLKLGLADDRIQQLVERLLAWQWPDGGWNCDKNPSTIVASFTESLIPLRGLTAYWRATGDSRVRAAIERAAEVFLSRHLFKRLSTGQVIKADFLKLHYPPYWHYDILFGLKVLGEADLINDPRCQEAIEILKTKQLPDGGFPAEAKFYQVGDIAKNGRSLVDWGGTSSKYANPFVTLEALRVLKKAGVKTN